MAADLHGRLHAPDGPLSRRQDQVLRAYLGGEAEKRVALQLGISPHTVHVYTRALFRRFGVRTRTELLALWISQPQGPERSESVHFSVGC